MADPKDTEIAPEDLDKVAGGGGFHVEGAGGSHAQGIGGSHADGAGPHSLGQ
jgi:hypothetical protein